MMPRLAICRKLTGNGSAAELLFRIAYWMPKAKVKRSGHKWVANSAQQWCEQTGLTYDQYRRAISLLKRLSLVETEQHLFAGKNITHVRLTEPAKKALGFAQLKDGHFAQAEISDTAQPKVDDFAQLNTQGVSYTEIQQKKQTQTLANAPVNLGNSLEKETGEENQEIQISEHIPECKIAKTKEVQKQKHNQHHQDQQSNSLSKPSAGSEGAQINFEATHLAPSQNECTTSSAGLSAPQKASSSPSPVEGADVIITASGLASIWAEIVQKKYGDYVPPATKKQLGQLKTFISLCPPGKSASILDVCLRNWTDFTMTAKSDYGAFGLPNRPTTDFLLKFAAASINFALEKLKKKQVKKSAPDKAPIPIFALPLKQPKPPKMTLEEFWAVDDDDDGHAEH